MPKTATFCPCSPSACWEKHLPWVPTRVLIFTLTVASCGDFDMSSHLSALVFFFWKLNFPTLTSKQYCQVWRSNGTWKCFSNYNLLQKSSGKCYGGYHDHPPLLAAWGCLVHGRISLPKMGLEKDLLNEQITVFSIFHFANNHPIWRFILCPVSVAPMPMLLYSSDPPPFHFFSSSQWLLPLPNRTLKNISYCSSSSWTHSFHLGFLFHHCKPKHSGFCPTTQLKLFPIVNVNSLIGKPNYLFIYFILLDILAAGDTLVTFSLVKFHPLPSWLNHPGSSDHTVEYPCWLPSHLLSVPTCGPNSHSLLI